MATTTTNPFSVVVDTSSTTQPKSINVLNNLTSKGGMTVANKTKYQTATKKTPEQIKKEKAIKDAQIADNKKKQAADAAKKKRELDAFNTQTQKKVLKNKENKLSEVSTDAPAQTTNVDVADIGKSSLQFPTEIRDVRQITFSIWEQKTFTNKLAKQIEESANSVGDGVNEVLQQNLKLDPEAGINYEAARKANLSTTIILPLPNTLRDSQGHDWSVEKGIIGTVVGSITNESMSSMVEGVGGIFSSIADLVPGGSKIKNIIDSTTAQASKRTGSVSIDQMLGSVSASTGFRKPMANPGYFQNYNGSRPRNFTMSWDLMPKNTSDAKLIFDIISSFKYFSSPTKSLAGVSMLAPHFFTLKIANQYLNNMILPGHLVITDISVDYAADGSFNLYDGELKKGGGFPKMINLSISFSDLRMRFSDDYLVPKKKDSK